MQIHELDTYRGSLDATAYFAVDNGNDTGKVSATELLSDANEAIDELGDFLNARIDNIITPGAAPSEAEVTDARLGANGITYPSLGDAIRDQIADLNAEVNALDIIVGKPDPEKMKGIIYGKSPAYTPQVIADNLAISQVPYIIKYSIATSLDSFSVYIQVHNEDTDTNPFNEPVTNASARSGEFRWTPSAAASNCTFRVLTSATSGLTAEISIEKEVSQSNTVEMLEDAIINRDPCTFTIDGWAAEYFESLREKTIIECQADTGYKILIVVRENGSIIYDSGYKNEIVYTMANEGVVEIRGVKSDYSNLTESDLEHFEAFIIKNVWSEMDGLSDKMNGALSQLNPFAFKPLYHHLNPESVWVAIPSQSLPDIAYAKSLGFNMIEVNPHKCSDGVFVCKHGNNGKLGDGIKAGDGVDYSETLFSSVSSTWLRNNITYDMRTGNYHGYIPTLDEFCAECKRLSMMVKTSSLETIPIVRKYLPDDMIFLTNTSRGDFTGVIEYIWRVADSIDDCISACKGIGSPLNIVIAAGEFSSATDTQIKELVLKAHSNGFTVGVVYPTTNDCIRALSLGVDAICSTYGQTNLLEVGNELNIVTLNDSRLVLDGGANYDSVNRLIDMPINSSVSVLAAPEVLEGICTIRVRYNGTLTIKSGADNDSRNLKTYANDGNKEVAYSIALQDMGTLYSRWIRIEANSATEIYTLKILCSRI